MSAFSRVKFIQLEPAVDVASPAAAGDPPGGPEPTGDGQAGPDASRQAAWAGREVRRAAGREDAPLRARLVQREREAYRIGLIRIRERALPMKLTRVEAVPDGSRLVFYFTAEGRVDFRDLVRELAGEFRTRIEMRQIGVRDEARLLGGYGSCGRPLCCSAWLQGFEPVSIKMAKQQDLSLNPWKLSGLCGRLKCCLRYELGDGRSCPKAAQAPLEAAPDGELDET